MLIVNYWCGLCLNCYSLTFYHTSFNKTLLASRSLEPAVRSSSSCFFVSDSFAEVVDLVTTNREVPYSGVGLTDRQRTLAAIWFLANKTSYRSVHVLKFSTLQILIPITSP